MKRNKKQLHIQESKQPIEADPIKQEQFRIWEYTMKWGFKMHIVVKWWRWIN